MHKIFRQTRNVTAVFAAMALSVAAFAVPANATDEATIAGTAIAVSSLDGFDDNNGDFDVLIHLLQAADLVGAVDDPSADLTVFAPTDQAFVRLARDLGFTASGYDEGAATDFIAAQLTELGGGDPIPVLTDVLLYHVSPGSTRYADSLRGNVTEVETLLGSSFTANGRDLVDAAPGIADARIQNPLTDIAASNGVVHGISRVLLPVALDEAAAPTNDSAPTIAGTAIAVSGDLGLDTDGGDFDILIQALLAADLVDAVDNPDADLTVFAPNDSAFIALATDLGYSGAGNDEAGALGFLLELFTELGDGDPIPLLTDVLLYHVSPGRTFYNGQLRGGVTEIPTLLGPSITAEGRTLVDVGSLENPRIRNEQTDIVTSNGVIQGISRVLIPLAGV